MYVMTIIFSSSFFSISRQTNNNFSYEKQLDLSQVKSRNIKVNVYSKLALLFYSSKNSISSNLNFTIF